MNMKKMALRSHSTNPLLEFCQSKTAVRQYLLSFFGYLVLHSKP